jgi:hypothetical protein
MAGISAALGTVSFLLLLTGILVLTLIYIPEVDFKSNAIESRCNVVVSIYLIISYGHFSCCLFVIG